ncbi:MAG: prolyl oligopeptidase family serine peptidase [Thermoguttaceae bacterium]
MFPTSKKILALTMATLSLAFSADNFAAEMSPKPAYPNAKKVTQTDDYFGITVADPYRWMEEKSPELDQWIADENAITQSYLRTIPFREKLRKELTDTINYPKHSLPWSKNGRLFYFKNTGLQNQSVLYTIDPNTTAPNANEPRVLIDPNTMSAGGTVAISGVSVSRDGKLLAYSVAKSGSDWNTIHVIDIATGETLPDCVEWVKFSGIAWQGNGFYYSRYDAPPEDKLLTSKNEFHKIYYHKVGSPQTDDVLIDEDREHPLRNRTATTDYDENYLFISSSESTYGETLKFRPTSAPINAAFVTIVDTFDSEYSLVAVFGDAFYFLTDRDAPNKRLVRISPAAPTPENWNDIIPEGESLLESVQYIGGRFVATTLQDAAHVATVYDNRGTKLRDVALPTLGVVSFSGEPDAPQYFQSFTSFTYPTVIERGNDINSDTREPFFPAAIDIDQAEFVTERVWYTNSDGKKVPIFLCHKAGLKRDGQMPVLLYGYGGFNASMKPSFSAERLVFLRNGGVYAMAILRGGGEYGQTWHEAGTKFQRQNVFDDFIAAAEFLINEKYTSPAKLAVMGGSNGGLLVGAVVTQRPELFRAGVLRVGVLDMLRYHLFTIGWAWKRDYGSSADSREMVECLLRYSPLHNVKAGVDYPSLLVMTSDHDDRVVPAHSFKFTATMQEVSTSVNPIYIRVETDAGHGAGKPISKIIDESTDMWSFVMEQIGMKME